MEQTSERGLVNPKTLLPQDASRDLRLETPFRECPAEIGKKENANTKGREGWVSKFPDKL